MDNYEIAKGLFVITLVVAMAMMVGIIDQQQNKQDTLMGECVRLITYEQDKHTESASELYEKFTKINDEMYETNQMNMDNFAEYRAKSALTISEYYNNQRVIIQNKTKVRVGSITIEIVDKCEVNMYAEGCGAWTDGYRIFIVNNQSLEYMKLACNHEMLHIVIDMEYDKEETYIRSIHDKFNFRECDAFFKLM